MSSTYSNLITRKHGSLSSSRSSRSVISKKEDGMSERVVVQKSANTTVTLSLMEEILSDDSKAYNIRLRVEAAGLDELKDKDGDVILEFCPSNVVDARVLFRMMSESINVS